MAYKIVRRHLLDEVPDVEHDENCTDIVYMIDTGNGKFPVVYSAMEKAQAKLDELNNSRN